MLGTMLKLARPPAMLKQRGRRQLAWRFPNSSVCYMNCSRQCAVATVLDYLWGGPFPSFRLTAPGVPINCSLQSSLQGSHLPGQDPGAPAYTKELKLQNWLATFAVKGLEVSEETTRTWGFGQDRCSQHVLQTLLIGLLSPFVVVGRWEELYPAVG